MRTSSARTFSSRYRRRLVPGIGTTSSPRVSTSTTPGTYLAGGYNRLVTEIAGRKVENEDLVNLPNWLVLLLRIEDGEWLRPDRVEILDYRQELALRRGLLLRTLRLRDPEGRTTRWEERRFVSMQDRHVAGLAVTVTPRTGPGVSPCARRWTGPWSTMACSAIAT